MVNGIIPNLNIGALLLQKCIMKLTLAGRQTDNTHLSISNL